MPLDNYQRIMFQVLSMGDLSPTAYSDDYWEKRYSLRRDRVPSFLLALTDQILRTGEWALDLRSRSSVVDWALSSSSSWHSLRSYRTSFASYFFRQVPERDQAVRHQGEAGARRGPPGLLRRRRFLQTGRRESLRLRLRDAAPLAHAGLRPPRPTQVRNPFWNVGLKDELVSVCRSVKHYFLLDAGDFILHFLSLCGSELAKNVDDVQPSRLESLLELALRTSTANADPFKDDLGLELLSHDLLTQMVRILSIQTNDERSESITFSSVDQLFNHTEAVAFSVPFRCSGRQPFAGTAALDGPGGVFVPVPRPLARVARLHLQSHGLLPDDLPPLVLRQIRREPPWTVSFARFSSARNTIGIVKLTSTRYRKQ